MLAKELMIGDLLNLSDVRGEIIPCKVVEIHTDELLVIQPNDTACDIVGYDMVRPIPLTQKILEKNGWTKRKGYPSEYEFIEGECVHVFYDTKHCHLMIDLYDDNIINIVENRTHRLQQALRLCGLTELADNFRV